MIEQVFVFVFGPVMSWLVCIPAAILAMIWGIAELNWRYKEKERMAEHYRNPDSVYR